MPREKGRRRKNLFSKNTFTNNTNYLFAWVTQGAYITGVEARSFAGKKFFDYTLFFCKNVLYKNVQAEIFQKFKNVLRIFKGSNFEIFLSTYINNGDVGCLR